MLVDDIFLEIFALQSEVNKASYLRFFKPETVVEDEFLGVKIPSIRKFAKKYYNKISLNELEKFIQNKYHEIRYFALSCLILRLKNKDEEERIVELYLKNLGYINNWDLVDISAPYILKNVEKNIVFGLVKSKKLWERRVGVLSQLAKIREGDFNTFIKIASFLIKDEKDLIQKPLGWLLREIGKVDMPALENFLNKNAQNMNRIALRYAIEKFGKEKRQKYLKTKKA